MALNSDNKINFIPILHIKYYDNSQFEKILNGFLVNISHQFR